MGYESTSVVSGSCPSVRRHLTAGGAVASAGILALSLVAAPPDFNDARTEVRTVQLAAFKLPPALPPGALLKQLVSNQADTVGAVALLVPGGAADITTAVVKTPFTFVRVLQPTGSATEAVRTTAESTIDPAIPSQQDNALLADEIFTNLVKVLLIPFVLAFVGVAWVISQIQIFFYNRENAAVASALTSEFTLSDSAPITIAKSGPADESPANEPGKADDSPPVRRPTDTPIQTERVTSTDTAAPTKDASEIANTDEETAGPTAASAPEPSAASKFEPVKPTVRPTTHRPVVRSLLGAGERVRDLLHRGNGSLSSGRTAAAGDEAPTAGPSSGDDSSGDDAGNS